MSKFTRLLLKIVFSSLVASNIGLISAQEAGFDEVYWAHQPPQIRVLKNLSDPALSTAAREAADKGFPVDVPIQVWKWRPWLVMMIREQQGLTWVPSANQEPLNLAGDALKYGFSGRSYEPKNPPPGTIKVSTRQSDYPAFDPPAPPPAPVSGLVVGGAIGFDNRFYSLPAGLNVPNGGKVIQDGRMCTKSVVNGVIGQFHFFTCQ